MDSGIIFVVAMLGMAVSTVLLGGYVFLLYRLGNQLARRIPPTVAFNLAIAAICSAWIPISFLIFACPIDRTTALGLFIGLFLLNSYPTCIGFAAERILTRVDSEKRFSKNVDDWLSQWECRETDEFPHEDLDLKKLPPADTNE